MPTFKWLFLNNLRSTTGMPPPASLFALDDTRTAIQSLLHVVVSSSAKHSPRLDIFPNRLDSQNLDPDHLCPD